MLSEQAVIAFVPSSSAMACRMSGSSSTTSTGPAPPDLVASFEGDMTTGLVVPEPRKPSSEFPVTTRLSLVPACSSGQDAAATATSPRPA